MYNYEYVENFYNIFYKIIFFFFDINFINLYLYMFILIIILCFINKYNLNLLKKVSLFGSLFIFIYSLILLYNYNFYNSNFEEIFYLDNFINNNIIFINFIIGIDSISILFIVLTTILCPLCILISWNNIKFNLKSYLILILFTEILLILVFSVLDIFLFYILFESILIPMFLIIGVWGSRKRRIHAAYQFFLYTIFGSIIMLLSLLFIYSNLKSTDYLLLIYEYKDYTNFFSKYREYILWLCFYIGFSIKIPMVPFHIWLPEAHVEAPTAGSVLLAGVLLKLGCYGFIRFSIPLLGKANDFFLPFIYTICILGIIYCSLTIIRQIDLKKMIAYSSVIHMNFCLLGLFTSNIQSISGSFFLMLTHGIVSGGLFLSIGILYERYNTRIIKYYNGLNLFMPIFSVIFLILILSNTGFPGTGNFIGEFLVIIGVFQSNIFIIIISSLSLIFSGAFSFWLYNRVFFGYLTNNFFFWSSVNPASKIQMAIFSLSLNFLMESTNSSSNGK